MHLNAPKWSKAALLHQAYNYNKSEFIDGIDTHKDKRSTSFTPLQGNYGASSFYPEWKRFQSRDRKKKKQRKMYSPTGNIEFVFLAPRCQARVLWYHELWQGLLQRFRSSIIKSVSSLTVSNACISDRPFTNLPYSGFYWPRRFFTEQ